MIYGEEDTFSFWFLSPRDDAEWQEDYPTKEIVAARSEQEAREIAAQKSNTIWLDRYNSSCEEIYSDEYDKPTLIIDSIVPQSNWLDTPGWRREQINAWMELEHPEWGGCPEDADSEDLVLAISESSWVVEE